MTPRARASLRRRRLQRVRERQGSQLPGDRLVQSVAKGLITFRAPITVHGSSARLLDSARPTRYGAASTPARVTSAITAAASQRPRRCHQRSPGVGLLPGPLSRIQTAPCQIVRALPPVVGVLGKADVDGELEIRRRLRLPIGHRHRILGEDRRNHGRIAVMRERALARGHLVKDHAEREDVGAGIGVAAFELLRRHVAQRAQNRVRTGEVGRPGGSSPRPAARPV